jgi:hypothetical protein
MKYEPPEGLTPQGRKEWERFLAVYSANLKRAESISLSILVWGPDPQRDSPVSNKRKEIRDELNRLGHNAMFSENIPKDKSGISEKSKEFAEALAAHLIIILVEDSPGALAEAHDFCNHPDIAAKVLILVPRRYKKGYSARGAIKDLEDAHGGVVWYADGDLLVCKVCAHALRRAAALRHLRFRGGSVL